VHQQDAGALHPAIRVSRANGAAGVQQNVVVGRWRRLAEDDPAAARIDGPIGEQELRGQVQREAAQQAAVGGVELYRRREPLTPELGTRPEEVRAVGVGGARGRNVVGELFVQRRDGVQFLDSTWKGTGVAKTSDPEQQFIGGFRYIQQRYGSPEAAWAFWQKHHWY